MQVNRNFIWSKVIVNTLINLGVKNVCISSGSRNTPLISAFANNNRIKKYVIIDERSSAFFAIGLADKLNQPVAVLSTSGTAAAEFTPAIIEAYFRRIPLIILTADRPEYLRNTGANQTINQDNIYSNHIRFFYNTGLPELRLTSIKKLINKLRLGISIALLNNKGPIHFNIPFEKPLEPFSYTDSIKEENLRRFFSLKLKTIFSETPIISNNEIKIFQSHIEKIDKGIIIAGYDYSGKKYLSSVIKLSILTGYPVLVDITSKIKSSSKNKSFIYFYDTFLRDTDIQKELQPEIIIQLGHNGVSKGLELFLQNNKGIRFIINRFGDNINPYLQKSVIIKNSIDDLVEKISPLKNKPKKRKLYLNRWIFFNTKTSSLFSENVVKLPFISEMKLPQAIFNFLPEKSNLFLGNSLIIRDFNSYVNDFKKINLFSNRGASGIDGNLSTAIGIAAAGKRPTLAVLGDLSFFYDINSLQIIKQNNIPIKVIVIDNNGGAIFRHLPIRKLGKHFNKFFITPHNLDLCAIVRSFGVRCSVVNSEKVLKEKLFKWDVPEVLIIRTNGEKSFIDRKTVQNKIIEKLKAQ